MASEKVILTVLCLIYDGNKILLQNRVKEDWKGFTLPGGHVEKNEPFVEAVIREIKEETGLNLNNPKLCGLKQFPTENDERYVVLLFKSNDFSGELTSSEEGEMLWVDKNDLNSINLANGFWDVLKIYDENLTELFYKQDKDSDKWDLLFY